jgi:hypothetical protein
MFLSTQAEFCLNIFWKKEPLGGEEAAFEVAAF